MDFFTYLDWTLLFTEVGLISNLHKEKLMATLDPNIFFTALDKENQAHLDILAFSPGR